MADENKARITQIDGYPEYCRRYNGATYDDYDDEVHAYDGTEADLWGGAAHILYWGSASKFKSMGFRVGSVVPDVGTITWQYSSGASGWTAFDGNNPFHNSTDGLTQDGYLAWQDPPASGTAWAAHTHSGALPSAYWVRASIASHTTTGKFYHFLRNVLLKPPVKLKPVLPAGRMFYDLASEQRKTDLAYDGPTRLLLHCEQIATVDGDADTMPNLTLLWYWFDDRSQLFIEDLAQSTIPNLTTGAFYKDYTARFANVPGEMESPYKMLPDGGYELAFTVNACTRIGL